MAFRSKVLLALLLAGVLPVAVAGYSAFRTNSAQLLSTVGELQSQASADLASSVAASVLQTVENLRTAVSYLRLSELEATDAEAVLQIPVRQFKNVRAVALVDSSGKPLTRTVAGAAGPLNEEALAAFGAHAPLRELALSPAAIGVPYRLADGPHVVVALKTSTEGDPILIADVSLADLEERLSARSADEVAFIASSKGEVVLHSESPAPALSADERAFSLEPAQTRTVSRGGEDFLLASAAIPELRWSAVTGRRSAVALLPATRVARYTLFWTAVALALTIAVSLLLSRGVSEPLKALIKGVRRLGEGKYGEKITVPSSDEFGELSAAFNQMSDEIARRDAEIRTWSEELQKRVDERTRELKEAQEQIIRARRLAAMGAFAAGVSHEINNPLTGVIGVLSLLQMDLKGTPASEVVDVGMQQAKRMAEVVKNLRETAERDATALGARIPLHRPVAAAIAARKDECDRRNVRVASELRPDLPPVLGDAQQLQQVVDQLLQNSVTAMPDGGEVKISVSTIGTDAIKLSVTDTGKGIPETIRDRIFDPFFTTKDEPGRMGMGLTVAARIVEAHQGRITVESEVGKGSTFNVILPAARERAHLV